MLLKMINGGIKDITEDSDSQSGCPTCDYGSSYTRYFDIELTTIKIHIEASEMYDYPLSEGQMMKTILPNVNKIQAMTEVKFAEWLKINLEKEVDLELTYEINKINKEDGR